MAFASVGARGSAQTKTAGTTLAMSPTSDMAAGALAVMFWAWDGGTGIGEASDNMNARWSCRDDAGNIWTTLAAATEGFDHAAAGIFVSRLRAGLTTADTVTIQCQITNRTCKAMSLHEFSSDPALRWAKADSFLAVAGIAADPAAVTLDPLDEQEYLLLYVLGLRGPSSDSLTWDSDYTQLTSVGTSGGADDSNMQLHSGFRIATLTSDTIDITNNTANRDYAEGYVALCEQPLNAFPTHPIIDDFNRADENPIDAGLWETGSCIPTFTNKARVVSNQAAGQAGGHGGQWLIETFPDCDAEVYATFPVFGSLGAGLLMHGTGCGNVATRDGYELEWLPIQGKADTDRFSLGTAGFVAGFGVEYIMAWVDPADGNKMGIQRTGKINNAWIDEGGGWEWTGGVYHASPQAPLVGSLGFELFEGTMRMDDFGGGYLCVPPFNLVSMNWRSSERAGQGRRVLVGG